MDEKQLEVLVKWKGLPDFECLWEPLKRLREQLQLEDKVSLLQGGRGY